MGKFNKLTCVIKLVNEHSIIYMELSETFLSPKTTGKIIEEAFIGILTLPLI